MKQKLKVPPQCGASISKYKGSLTTVLIFSSHPLTDSRPFPSVTPEMSSVTLPNPDSGLNATSDPGDSAGHPELRAEGTQADGVSNFLELPCKQCLTFLLQPYDAPDLDDDGRWPDEETSGDATVPKIPFFLDKRHQLNCIVPGCRPCRICCWRPYRQGSQRCG